MEVARPQIALSPFALLGITPASNADEIRAAYKKRCLETHPDKGGDPEEFRRVQKAYQDVNRTQKSSVTVLPKPRDRSRSPPRFNVKTIFSHTERLTKAKRREKHEEDVHNAFGSFTTARAENKSEVPARPGVSFAAKVTVEASALNQQRNRFDAAKLWDKLTKMTPQKRQEAMMKLKKEVKAELTKYLQQRKTQRVVVPKNGSTHSASEDSSSSSSSSSEDERTNSNGGKFPRGNKDPRVGKISSQIPSSRVFKKIKPKATNGKVLDLDS